MYEEKPAGMVMMESSKDSWACTGLDGTLGPIHNAQKIYRDQVSGGHYDPGDGPLAKTRAELADKIIDAKLPVDLVLDKVAFEPDLQVFKDQGSVGDLAKGLLQRTYPSVDYTTADLIYLRLYKLVADSTGKPIARQQVLDVIDAARAQRTALVDHYPILHAPLREVFRPLLDDRTKLFGGRDAALAKIAAFIEDPKGGYLAITAPPGFGKTALMATLVRAAPEAYAYHFFTPLYPDSLSEPFFSRSVLQPSRRC